MWKIPTPDIQRTDYWIMHGRQPAGVAAARCSRAPTSSARSTASARAAARSSSIDPRRTGTADHADEWVPIRARHRRRVPARDRATCSSPRASSTSARVGEHRRRRRRRCATPCAEFTPERGRGVLPGPGRHDPPPRARVRRRADGRGLRPHRHCATRSSARSRRGWSTWSTSSPATSTGPAGSCSATRSRGRWRRCPTRKGRRRAVRALDSRACAARPRCSARCRCSCLAEEIATPGDGPDQGARHDRRQPGDQRARRRPPRRGAARARLHDQRRQLPQRDDAPRHVILPGPSPLETAALRRPDRGAGPARSGGNWSDRGLPAARRPARTSGRSSPASAGCCAGGTRRRHRRRRARRRLVRRALPRRKGVDAGRRRSPRYDRRRPRADARPADPHRPVGRPLRRGARRPHARADQGRSRTASTSARWCRACREMVVHARRAHRPRARVHRRRPAAARGARLDRRGRRRCVLVEPPPPALEQLVDAQREGAGEGQGPLHAARPPRRRRGASACVDGGAAPGSRSEAGSVEVPVEVSDEMMPRRGVAAPRLGPRPGPAPGWRSPGSTPA